MEFRDRRRLGASLRVPADRDPRPLRLALRQETRPILLGIVSGEVCEELPEPVIDAVGHIDVHDRAISVDAVEVFEVRVLPAGIRVGSYSARDRESWTAVHVHQADDVVAEPRGLLLHELYISGWAPWPGMNTRSLWFLSALVSSQAR